MTNKKYKINEAIDVIDENKKKSISYFQLYRFATKYEIILIILGVILSCLNSFALPLIIIIYGEFTTLLVDRAYGVGTSSDTVLLQYFGGGTVLTNATREENTNEIYNDSISYGILMTIVTVLQFFTGALSVDLFNYTSLKQITRIRSRFLGSVLRQEIGWHDINSGDNFGSRITEDIEKIRDGISEKVSMCISLFMCFVVSVVIAFIYGWKLTLVVIACVPVLITTSLLVAKFQSSLTTKELQSYSNAGSVAEEVLLSIRTVMAFGGEGKESERYNTKLTPAEIAGKRKGLWSGCGEGIMKLTFFASNALAFWYGVTLILEDRDKPDKEYTPAVLMITFFGILVGSDNIARMAPFIGNFAIACGAAETIFKVIDRVPKIDPMSLDGKIVKSGIRGEIIFQNITFQYPSRSDVQVLRSLNLKVKVGQTVALVGSSGCGKSTCIQLVQRFYDPASGSILIDGNDLRKMNISWLRSNIATVGQEPILFATTIGENIRHGKPDATDEEIEDAARASSAHDFVSSLPDKYNTLVGERGALLSGGQKQRIAIARALIQNPRILLLDEATSALDSQSEKIVQKALDSACKGRTTLIVSHRLSTIRQADRIVCMDKGQIVEDGTHEELLKLEGFYYNMVQAETRTKDNIFDDHNNENEMEVIEKSAKINQMVNLDQKFELSPVLVKNEELPVSESLQIHYLLKRILRIARPEIFFIILGCLSALLAGASYPAFAVLFGDVYGALSLPKASDVLDKTHMLCICFIAVGIVTGLSVFLQNYLFSISGVYLTTRIRSILFKAMLKQEMGWFDQESNSIGALCTRLSMDAANIQGAIGQPLGGIFQAISTFVFGVTVAFIYCWKLALVCLAAVPLVVGSVLFEAKFMTKASFAEKTIMEEATQIGLEAISNVRTVASLRQESPVIVRYCEAVHRVETVVRKKLMFRGLVFSIGQAVPFLAYALALYYGGYLVADDNVPYQNIIKVSESLIFGAMMLGQSLAFAPAFTAAFVAASRVLSIVDRKPHIRSPYNLLEQHKKVSNENTVNYSNVKFSYPKRPDVPILQGLDMEVITGKTVALVGHSGCGKSTCIQLLQRLYDPDNGRIFINVDEITNDIALDELRRRLGIVSQEPVLFDRTITENIAYGDNTKNVHLAEVIEASKIANMHHFILSLPLGYDTRLGTKGTQLSGGQKQRIAIARALVRNPKILLLDEATSALDSQSEKTVQTALEIARSGRTCIIIAHRLSTIQNADLICVIQSGRVIEQGTHDQLLAKGGFYWKLHNIQTDKE